jgi:hypothetical protein
MDVGLVIQTRIKVSRNEGQSPSCTRSFEKAVCFGDSRFMRVATVVRADEFGN